MNSATLNRVIYQCFSPYGISLQKEAFNFLKESISDLNLNSVKDVQSWLTSVASEVLSREFSLNLKKKDLELIFTELINKSASKDLVVDNNKTTADLKDINPYFQVIDLFNITPIKNLIGCQGNEFLIFGMLTEMVEGKIHLEDPDAYVELSFNEISEKGPGVYTLNCFVFCYGYYDDEKIFNVSKIFMPPIEDREQTIMSQDFFVGKKEETFQDIKDLKLLENSFDVSIVILSDVWLDKPIVFTKLRTMFEGYNDNPPLAFIFIGSFISTPYKMDGSDQDNYTESFNHLADLISEYPSIAKASIFVFVPGSNDPLNSQQEILPKKQISEIFYFKLKLKVENLIFTTNPCRIKYFTLELVIFKDYFKNRILRNCIFSPEEKNGELQTQFLKTVLSQAHLVPLPTKLRPTYWMYDHCLRLNSLPHLLCLADIGETFWDDTLAKGTIVCNPGVFSNDFKFLFYRPSENTIEAAQIP
ncbi:DNA polymerase epsilon subunit 2 [Clydaea vesicula]|uniref:DNA polymerase epsilon subunit B n=1 Tax=Clydaea vesicula TaxID=447962 RepID=A0AAD5U7H2_9FUNG|nr:DNA polymerase epsilon subunit 2 [Clydaea vesicula]